MSKKGGGWRFHDNTPKPAEPADEPEPPTPRTGTPIRTGEPAPPPPSLKEKLKAQLRPEEGFRAHAYHDSLGHATIGYGFLLERPDADKILSAMGLSPSSVRSGWPITRQQAEELLDGDATWALIHAEHILNQGDPMHPSPEAWGSSPETVKLVLGDMAFQLGSGGLGGFHHMLDALRHQDYKGAAKEMRTSLWAKQTPGRCKALADAIEALSWANPQDSA